MKRKMAIMLAITMLASSTTPAINIFADDKVEEVINSIISEISVSKFDILNNKDLKKYDNEYKVKVKNISNNGGNYGNSTIANAIDDDLKTHWETGKPNKNDFKNEVIIELEKEANINRIVYGSRQDGAKGKGFATSMEVYVTETGDNSDFTLVGNGKHIVTGDIMEFKFDAVKTKKFKIVFREAHQEWASASEFWFYKEDSIIDKMKKLFTNSSKNQLSEEYNTIEKLIALEEEIKIHPLYDSYKEDLMDAREIIENKEISYIDTRVSKFVEMNLVQKEDYDKLFKMPISNIERITTNGGHYAEGVIEFAVDGTLENRWHSGKQNSDTHTNEVIITLKDKKIIDRIKFEAARGTNRGFPEQFEIQASTTSKGETFKKISKGYAPVTHDALEFKFNPIEVKRLKFIFTKGVENWAEIGEMTLYTQDKLADEINNLFIDGTHIKVKDEYDLSDIAKLEDEAKNHPLKKQLLETLDDAKEAIENKGNYLNVMEVPARGDSIKESQKRKVWNFQDWQPTGYIVKPGDKIEVFVDVEPGKPTPRLIYKQMDVQSNGTTDIHLSPGKNVITIPDTYTDSRRPNVVPGGPLYVVNSNSKEAQGRTPKMRIEGAKQYPHFIKGKDTDEKVLMELEDYVNKMKIDKTLPDVFEVFSDKTLSNVKATYALDYYKQNAKQKPSRTADKQDDIIRNIMDYWGFDGSNELNSDFNFRYVQMVKYLDGGGFMNAGNGITGINKNEQGAILGVDTGWGTMHELGHNFDTRNRNIIEVSNNMVPQWFMYLENKPSRITNNNSWENDIFPKVTKEDYSNNQWYPADSPYNLQRLAPLWQLQIYDTTFWPKFEKKFREIKFNGGNEVEIHNAWLAIASDVLQLDLSEHFERHGMKVHADTKAYISKYTKSDKKLWYVNDKIYADNKYEKFTDSLDYSISSANLNNNQVTLELTMDKENIKNTLGYEVYRDDKLIGFTEKQTFIDKDIQEGKNYEYKVVAFDKSITPSGQAIRKLYTPKINVQDEINVELNSKFDPLKYVVAKTYDNKDITYNVKVIDNNVDTLAKGEYEVEYAIEAEGTTITDKAKVTVVSSIDYLSDGNATSSRVGWGKVEKDLAPDKSTIKLKRKGSEIEYAKGVGAHAESKLVYNIENKGFEFFESYIGIDDCARGTKASATFEIYADDKKIYDSGLMTGNDEQKHVKVLLKGINELKLITTDGGSNSISSDQTVWADAKFISNDSKPILTLDKSVATKVGEPIEDIIGEIMATDKEDGDISSSVEVTGNKDIDFNRTGKHTLIYTVTDSDGNRVTEDRTISVVDMEDSKELTDCDYKSAVQSYSKVYIDKSVSSNPLRLTDKDGGVIEFAKGIGAHSTSTVIYDIATLDADYFTAKVGVDRAMYGTVGSVSFEVHLDGTKVFDSGVMSSRDSYKEVEVSLAGSKELKLIVKDGGNGNGSDHATWGDTKLHFVNSTRIYTDFSELDTILESTTHLEGYLYETNSWRLLEEDINKGVIVLENKNATQEEVDKSLNDLKVSLESLAISKGKEKLKVTLDIAKAKQEEDYNSRGWETFILARDRAEEIYNELGHNESELERYNMSLTIYMGQLTMK